VTAAAPGRYDVRISHHRRDPVGYGFTQRGTTWLVDLDDVPSLPKGLRWLCRFSSRDHLGTREGSLREDLDRWVGARGVRRPARVLMLASPRVLGHVFNPLTLYYCYDGTGAVRQVVAEVRNTYGGRHCYLLTPDGRGRAEADKAFYVSPFNPVDGHYTMHLPEPGDHLTVTVTLHRPGSKPFTATMSGERGPTSDLWQALRRPWANWAVSFGIRKHGVRLYLKGLRPVPRPQPEPAQPANQRQGSTTR
jgi:uncharacterized protein